LDVKAAFFERDPMPQDLKTDIAANKASADAAKDVLRKSQQELPTPVST
jgi:hypothetical protein